MLGCEFLHKFSCSVSRLPSQSCRAVASLAELSTLLKEDLHWSAIVVKSRRFGPFCSVMPRTMVGAAADSDAKGETEK